MRLIRLFPVLLLSSVLIQAEPIQVFLDEETPYSVAIDQLARFPAELNHNEIERCLDFLKKKFNHVTDELFIVRQNNLADLLMQREATAIETTNVLIDLILAESTDLLWRDYCLQKLPLIFDLESAPKVVELRVIETLKRFAGDLRSSLAGTSLASLYRLRDQPDSPDFVSETIALSRAVLDTPQHTISNKVTALQVAILLGDAEALSTARSYVYDDGISAQLKISAIASIAQRGDASDLSLIEPLEDSLDLRLRTAARAATERLRTSHLSDKQQL